MKIKNLFKIIFVITLYFLYSSNIVATEKQAPLKKFKYNNFDIRIVNNPVEPETYSKDELVISQNQKELFHGEGLVDLKQGYELKDVIDSINSPILIINDYSGGAHCCITTTIVDLSKDYKTIAQFEGLHSDVKLKKLEDKNSFEVKLKDWVFAYKWTSFSGSYAPEVILKEINGKYIPDIKSMTKKPMSDNELKKMITDINSHPYKNFRYSYVKAPVKLSQEETDSNELYFSRLLPVVLDLIYTGRANQAWKVINETWPKQEIHSKTKFIEDLKSSLKESAYYEYLRELNKPEII